jgi:hypothetical protein
MSNERIWSQPTYRLEIKVVRRGVDLVITTTKNEPVCTIEMDQDQAANIAAQLMWREGCRAIQWVKGRRDYGEDPKEHVISFDFKHPHPFDAVFNAPDPKDGEAK